jgi:hypothetical protein
MIRTTVEAVALICEIDTDISEDLAPFIETANNIVDQVCLDSGYSDATLELIERWLSAHFYNQRDPLASQEAVKGVSVTYEGRTYTGFRNTRFGQQAMMIDTAGNLKLLDDMDKYRIRGAITHIGTNRSSCRSTCEDSET